MAFMAGLAAAAPYISAGATIASTIGQANAAEKIAEIEADQLNTQAISDKAQAVQLSRNEKRRADLLRSRVVALSAKSGSGLSSPDIQNIIGDIDAQGEYNALAALHSGYSAAGSKQYAAQVALSRGKQAKAAGGAKVGATLLDEVQNRYG